MNEILHLINEMSPYLLLGFFIAGVMHAFIPGQYYARYLARPNFRSVLNAALLGIPLPLCSCGVIPTAMSLKREGASHGAVVSFLIATPQTGIDSIAATYSLLGLPFAIIRPFAALVTAMFGGTLANHCTPAQPQDDEEETSCCCCHEEKKPEPSHSCCCCHEEETPAKTDCCCCHEEEPPAKTDCCCCHEEETPAKTDCCCHHDDAAATASPSFFDKMKVAIRYAFVDMMGDIGKWLIIGLVIAGLITVFVPDSAFAVFKDNTLLSMLLVLVISIPMYVCATGSIPIAVALMMKGLTPGAAFLLLMAGPAANMASVLVIRHRLGTSTLVAYLTAIIGGAVLFGLGIDYLLPRTWFQTSLITDPACCDEQASLLQWLCTAALLLLLIGNFIAARLRPHGASGSCCCHKD